MRLPSSVSYEDLVSAGMLGLVEAVGRYDEKKASHFVAFARLRVRGAMLDELRNLDVLPRSVRENARRVESARRAFIADHGREPESSELAERAGMSLEDLQKMQRQLSSGTVLHLEDLRRTSDSDNSRPAEEFIANEKSPSGERKVRDKEVRTFVTAAVEGLPERWQLVLSLYYLDELHMHEIAETLGVTEGRISQIHSAAIGALRKRLSGHVVASELREAMMG